MCLLNCTICEAYYGLVNEISLHEFLSIVFSLASMLTTSLVNTFSVRFLIKNLHFILTVMEILLVFSGSVETNLGPNPNSKNTLSFALWNLDSLPARDYSRIPVIDSLQAVHNFDLFAICESSLNELISNDNLLIHGFSPKPLRADKSLTAHNGGVCLFFKENIPLKRRDD